MESYDFIFCYSILGDHCMILYLVKGLAKPAFCFNFYIKDSDRNKMLQKMLYSMPNL